MYDVDPHLNTACGMPLNCAVTLKHTTLQRLCELLSAYFMDLRLSQSSTNNSQHHGTLRNTATTEEKTRRNPTEKLLSLV